MNERQSASTLGVPAWSKYPWLRAGFSTRLGGQSVAYGPNNLNLGWTDSDAAATVRKNRATFIAAVGCTRSFDLVTLRQFHGAVIRHINKMQGPLATEDGRAVLRGDGLIADSCGVLLGIQTADCVPVLLADTKLRVVAAFHAGWRGTLQRIVERGLGDMSLLYGSKPRDIVAAIGPCIQACCFAVGQEVRSDFRSQFAYGDLLFSERPTSTLTQALDPSQLVNSALDQHADGKRQIYLDLVAANRRQLLCAGVPETSITQVSECTSCTYISNGRRKYFSHRAERGFTGRMMSVIGVAPE